MKNRFLSMLVLAGTCLSFSAFAMTLDAARTSGAVGEKQDGYVEAIKPSPEVRDLVSTVNAKRKEEYARISKQNGQPVDVVAKLAAQQIIGKLAPGALYQGANGWTSK